MLRSLRSRQPYPGPMRADTRLARNYLLAGDVSNNLKERFMRQAGRSLAGFGDVTGPSGPGGDPDTADESVRGMEDADDTVGSGIFDQPGAGPTANANLGVLASYYALPGYLAREVPHTVSRDEVDATSDAPIVSIPGGALPYVTPYPARPGSPRDATYVNMRAPGGPAVLPAGDQTPGADFVSAVPVSDPRSRMREVAVFSPRDRQVAVGGVDFKDPTFWAYALVGAAAGVVGVWAWNRWRPR